MTAKQFRQARVRLGYRQAKLAEVLQLSRMTISRYEASTWEVPLSVEMALDQLGAAQIQKEEGGPEPRRWMILYPLWNRL